MRNALRFVCFIFMLSFAVASALLLGSGTVLRAYAEEVTLGVINITYEYGDTINRDEVRSYTDGSNHTYYYKINNYFGVPESNGAIQVELVDSSGEVIGSPDNYTITVSSATTQACDSAGNNISGTTYNGTINVSIIKRNIVLGVAAGDAEKNYGDIGGNIAFSYKDSSDEILGLDIALVSEGQLSTVSVGSYFVTVAYIKLSGVDVSAYYDVTVQDSLSSAAVEYQVQQRAISVQYSTINVEFNDFYLSDGESVALQEVSGVNGESIKVYYKLETAPITPVLTLNDRYNIVFNYFTVTSGEITQTYTPDSTEADYAVNIDYTSNPNGATVLTISGDLCIFTDVTKQSDYQNTAGYIYINVSFFTFTYADECISDYANEISIGSLELPYEGLTLTLIVKIIGSSGSGAVDAGSYTLEVISWDNLSFTNVTLEGGVRLEVNPLPIGDYNSEDSIQYGIYSDTFQKEVAFDYNSVSYSFVLSGDVTGITAGGVAYYSEVDNSNNPNYIITYSSAVITVVKRTNDVTVVEEESSGDIYFGDVYEVGRVYLLYGEEGQTELSGAAFSYRTVGATSEYLAGLPAAVGTYQILCSLSNDNYALSDEYTGNLFIVTIHERPIAVEYNMSSAVKTYGTSFTFDSTTVQFSTSYFYDKVSGSYVALRSGLTGTDSVGGTITCGGFAASANAGNYNFNYSNLFADNYEICQLIIMVNGVQAEQFTVNKAAKPITPSIELGISGRTVTVTAVTDIDSIRYEMSTDSANWGTAKSSTTGAAGNYSGLKYGQKYYFRARVTDFVNYETADSDWSEVQFVITDIPALSVSGSESTTDSISLELNELSNTATYAFWYKLGSGEWGTEGTFNDLEDGVKYTIYYRCATADAVTPDYSVDIYTLRAALPVSGITAEYDELTGTITANNLTDVEYRLLNSRGDTLVDWQNDSVFPDIIKGEIYRLEIRLAASGGQAASEITILTVSTVPAADVLTIQEILSKSFLLIVTGALFIMMVTVIIVFVNKKRKIDAIIGGINDK